MWKAKGGKTLSVWIFHCGAGNVIIVPDKVNDSTAKFTYCFKSLTECFFKYSAYFYKHRRHPRCLKIISVDAELQLPHLLFCSLLLLLLKR